VDLLSKYTSPQGDGNNSNKPVVPSFVSFFPNTLPRKGMETFNLYLSFRTTQILSKYTSPQGDGNLKKAE